MTSVYPVTEMYGSWTESIDDAIRQAVSAAHQTIRNLEWFEVTEIRSHVANDGSVGHFQVGVKLGFRLERESTQRGLKSTLASILASSQSPRSGNRGDGTGA